MRPRIDGTAARIVMLLQDGDETYSEAIARLIDGAPYDADLPLPSIPGENLADDAIQKDTIRRRIRGDAEDALRDRMDSLGVTANDALASMFEGAVEQADALDTLADGIGRTPRSRDVSEADDDTLKIGALQDTFGTFNNALKVAGFEPNEEKTGPLPKDRLLDALVAFDDSLDHEPTAREVADHGPHSLSTYYNHFGGLTRAKKIAGIRDLDINDIVFLSIISETGPATADEIEAAAEDTFGRGVRAVEDRIELLSMAGLVAEDDGEYVTTDAGDEKLDASEWSQSVAQRAT